MAIITGIRRAGPQSVYAADTWDGVRVHVALPDGFMDEYSGWPLPSVLPVYVLDKYIEHMRGRILIRART